MWEQDIRNTFCVIIIRSLCNLCQIRLHKDPINDTMTWWMTQQPDGRHNDLTEDTMSWKNVKKVRFLYINIIRVLKRKKGSFLWCNLFKKIMSYVKVINV